MHNPLPQTVALPQSKQARYIKIEATTPNASTAVIELEELGVTVILMTINNVHIYCLI